MDRRVPILISRWSGTGTVIVDVPTRFCITTWLPRCRTAANPCRSKIRHTSLPENTPNLGMDGLEAGHKDFVMEPFGEFLRRRALEEQFNGLTQVGQCLFHGVALAGNIEFRAQRHVTVALALEDRCELAFLLHAPTIHVRQTGAKSRCLGFRFVLSTNPLVDHHGAICKRQGLTLSAATVRPV